MIKVILVLRAWYWEVRCFNAWLDKVHYDDQRMKVLHEHRHDAAKAAMRGQWTSP